MNEDVKVLIQAIEVAQKRGAYSLQEVAQILPAIARVQQPQPKEEPKKSKK